MKKTIFAIIAIAGILTTMGIVLASNKKKIEENKKVVDRSKVAVSVAVEKVAMADFAGTMNFSGVLEARTDADISVSTPGKIKTLHLVKGMYVRQGQIVGTVDNEQLKLRLKALQITESKLKIDSIRVRDLVQGNAAPETNLQDLTYNLASTRVQIEQINQSMNDNNIVSPISGQVTVKNMEAGEYANPGMPIAHIVDVSGLGVVVHVNEKHIYKLKEQQAATITADALPGKSFAGKVSYISPIGDENHNYRVEVSLDAEGTKALRSGTYAIVNLGSAEASKGLQIPSAALVAGAKEPFVYVMADSIVKTRKIVIGRQEGDMVEVIEGLKEGESVVTAGQINLTEGTLVKVSNQ